MKNIEKVLAIEVSNHPPQLLIYEKIMYNSGRKCPPEPQSKSILEMAAHGKKYVVNLSASIRRMPLPGYRNHYPEMFCTITPNIKRTTKINPPIFVLLNKNSDAK